MFFITKTVTTDLFIFKEKYEKGTLCLPSNNQASLLEKNFGFWQQGKLWHRKIIILHPNYFYEMYCANENIRDNTKMKYFL